MEPNRVARVNVKMSFFNPFKDEYKFYNEEKKKILRSIFMVFYMEELRDQLKEIILKNCRNCNQTIAGKAAPVNYPHSCQKFKTLRQGYNEYGVCVMSRINLDNKIRWKICKKFWDFVIDLPASSSIKVKDAIKFSQEPENDFFHCLLYEWEDEFENIMERFSWEKPNSDSIYYMLYELTKW